MGDAPAAVPVEPLEVLVKRLPLPLPPPTALPLLLPPLARTPPPMLALCRRLYTVAAMLCVCVCVSRVGVVAAAMRCGSVTHTNTANTTNTNTNKQTTRLGYKLRRRRVKRVKTVGIFQLGVQRLKTH